MQFWKLRFCWVVLKLEPGHRRRYAPAPARRVRKQKPFSQVPKRVVSKRVVLADVPLY